MQVRCISLSYLIILTSFSALFGQDRTSGRLFTSRSEVLSRHGMAATSHPLATQIAIDILKKGGTAVDAAIAANAFLGVADPGMNGIGGDLFAIVWDAKTGRLYGLNGSGRSPETLTSDYFKNKGLKRIPSRGPLAVSVPGCVDAWFELHTKFGRIGMEQLLAPAIAYAREGVPVSQEFADLGRYFQPMMDTLQNPNFKALYCVNNQLPQKGQIFKNPQLANTLQMISEKGRNGFYTGKVAETIEKHMKAAGGFLTAKDLAVQHAEWVEPVSTNYRGYDVWELPPNGQGIAVLQMLNILEGFDLAKYGYGSPEHIHYVTEAKRLAFEDMARYYGDPAFSEIPVKKLISKEYAAERRKLIMPDRVGTYQPGPVNESNTIYLTVADEEGNMVSFIQSNYSFFGSMEVPAGLGFCLQNRGSGFDLTTGMANSYAPAKRPFHTIIPAFLTKDGRPCISFGVMGGDMQTQGHVQVLLNLIDFGMNLQEAGDAPRFKHDGTFPTRGTINPGEIRVESGFSYETIRALMIIGHKVTYDYGNFGGYQAIMLKDSVYYGASDSRKDGQAAGY
jgi:gamma-glutamyltranspeptidase / glutathione hydrolase